MLAADAGELGAAAFGAGAFGADAGPVWPAAIDASSSRPTAPNVRDHVNFQSLFISCAEGSKDEAP